MSESTAKRIGEAGEPRQLCLWQNDQERSRADDEDERRTHADDHEHADDRAHAAFNFVADQCDGFDAAECIHHRSPEESRVEIERWNVGRLRE